MWLHFVRGFQLAQKSFVTPTNHNLILLSKGTVCYCTFKGASKTPQLLLIPFSYLGISNLEPCQPACHSPDKDKHYT